MQIARRRTRRAWAFGSQIELGRGATVEIAPWNLRTRGILRHLQSKPPGGPLVVAARQDPPGFATWEAEPGWGKMPPLSGPGA